MRLLPVAATALLLAGLSACTWVHMAPGAKAVRVVATTPAGCERRGEVEVSVKERVAFYERNRSKEHTSELQSLMRISYAVFCLKKKKKKTTKNQEHYK